MAERTLIAENQTGTRTIAGTDWPVLDQVHRLGKGHYLVTFGLCNGVPGGTWEYRTLTAALKALDASAEAERSRRGSVPAEKHHS